MDRIILAYYAGCYGPTIRIDTQTVGQLKTVIDLFTSLTRSEHATIGFCPFTRAERDDIGDLVLLVVPAEPDKALRLVRQLETGPVFEWSRSPDGWEDCCALLDGMPDAAEACHQYLTHPPTDDALIEVAFKEYRPPW